MQFLQYNIYKSIKHNVLLIASSPVVRVEPGEVGAFDHSSKSADFCVAKSAISEVEASPCHAVVCSEPYGLRMRRNISTNESES